MTRPRLDVGLRWMWGAVVAGCLALAPAGASAQILYCGDGIVTPELNEECDDGNNQNYDGCDAQCLIERCGDGIVQPPAEECDDGNTVGGDGCSEGCEFEHFIPVCGDGVVEEGESCDDGNTVGGDGCSPICQTEICGNNFVDVGEACDDGFFNGFGACCTVGCECKRCGNGVLDTGADCPTCVEACDDGNLIDGDGCSSSCEIEVDEIECCVDRDGDGWMTIDMADPSDCVGPEIPITIHTPQYVGCGTGGSPVREDCDDGNAAVNPAASEIPNNGTDENCNGTLTCGAVDDDVSPGSRKVAALVPLLAIPALAAAARRNRSTPR